MLLNVSFIWFGKRFFNLFQPSFLLLIETSHWVLKVNQTTFSMKKWVKMSDGRILREKFPNTKFFWSVSFCNCTEQRKIWTRENFIFGHFSCSSIIERNWKLIRLFKNLLNSFTTEVLILLKPVHWFALQINKVVSTWWGPPSWKS